MREKRGSQEAAGGTMRELQQGATTPEEKVMEEKRNREKK